MVFRGKIVRGLMAVMILGGCSTAPESKRNTWDGIKTTCPGYTKPMLVPVDKHPDSYIVYPEQRKDIIYRERKD